MIGYDAFTMCGRYFFGWYFGTGASPGPLSRRT
jgi:hypothetical protein